uniref:Uncharacterized protein n=1 Tax=Timema bartmani TaxID=61472 RepID=A0A7R9HYF0_9NEOP|nr:unnamed protein product [Timema bartmani]
MQCEIRGMADVAETATSSADTLPKPGRVNEVKLPPGNVGREHRIAGLSFTRRRSERHTSTLHLSYFLS